MIVIACWFLVLTGSILSLWSAAGESPLTTSRMLAVALMA